MKKDSKKVVVGLSGGIDSFVAVALLKEQGYEVRGVFLSLENQNNKSYINTQVKEVKNISKILDIPLKIINAQKQFEERIIKYFLEEYAKGRTPNPCVLCNEQIKFKFLLDERQKLKANYVATGHYAKIKTKNVKNAEKKLDFTFGLYKAKDKSKDQSYFLYRLKQNQLAKIIFPLGNYEKKRVKEIATRLNWPFSQKKESQDVCFLKGTNLEKFLKKNILLKKGEIIDFQGKVIGQHFGLPLYTLGQRKGINIGGKGPYYVVAKDFKKNKLIVTNNKRNSQLYAKSIVLKEVNWIITEPKLPIRVLLRTRYQSPLFYATIDKKTFLPSAEEKRKKMLKVYKVNFEKRQKAPAPGQSAVFYNKKGKVLGGGIIN